MIKKPPEAWMECRTFTGDITFSERSCMGTAGSVVRVMWTVQWNTGFGNAVGLKREEENSREKMPLKM